MGCASSKATVVAPVTSPLAGSDARDHLYGVGESGMIRQQVKDDNIDSSPVIRARKPVRVESSPVIGTTRKSLSINTDGTQEKHHALRVAEPVGQTGSSPRILANDDLLFDSDVIEEDKAIQESPEAKRESFRQNRTTSWARLSSAALARPGMDEARVSPLTPVAVTRVPELSPNVRSRLKVEEAEAAEAIARLQQSVKESSWSAAAKLDGELTSDSDVIIGSRSFRFLDRTNAVGSGQFTDGVLQVVFSKIPVLDSQSDSAVSLILPAPEVDLFGIEARVAFDSGILKRQAASCDFIAGLCITDRKRSSLIWGLSFDERRVSARTMFVSEDTATTIDRKPFRMEIDAALGPDIYIRLVKGMRSIAFFARENTRSLWSSCGSVSLADLGGQFGGSEGETPPLLYIGLVFGQKESLDGEQGGLSQPLPVQIGDLVILDEYWRILRDSSNARLWDRHLSMLRDTEISENSARPPLARYSDNKDSAPGNLLCEENCSQFVRIGDGSLFFRHAGGVEGSITVPQTMLPWLSVPKEVDGGGSLLCLLEPPSTHEYVLEAEFEFVCEIDTAPGACIGLCFVDFSDGDYVTWTISLGPKGRSALLGRKAGEQGKSATEKELLSEAVLKSVLGERPTWASKTGSISRRDRSAIFPADVASSEKLDIRSRSSAVSSEETLFEKMIPSALGEPIRATLRIVKEFSSLEFLIQQRIGDHKGEFFSVLKDEEAGELFSPGGYYIGTCVRRTEDSLYNSNVPMRFQIPRMSVSDW